MTRYNTATENLKFSSDEDCHLKAPGSLCNMCIVIVHLVMPNTGFIPTKESFLLLSVT